MTAAVRAGLVALAFVIANPAGSRAEAPPALTVTQIFSAGRSVEGEAGVTLRAFDGNVTRRGVVRGQVLPDDVRVEVPVNESLIITSAGGSKATLEAGAIDTFHYTGIKETVGVLGGKTAFDDPLDFYHSSGPSFDALAQGTVYAVEASSNGVSITCAQGRVRVAQVIDVQGRSEIARSDELGAGASAQYGSSLQPDPSRAASQLAADRAAAEAGSADAQVNLAYRYVYGLGVARDFRAAQHWLELAAAQGNAVAEWGLGTAYEAGVNGPADDAQAFHWYQLAAAQGLPAGELYLAELYGSGRGVTADEGMALHLIRLSVAQGYGDAETELGDWYRVGIGGLPKDLETARRWYRIAAAQGTESGELALMTFSPSLRQTEAYAAEGRNWAQAELAHYYREAYCESKCPAGELHRDYRAALELDESAAAQGDEKAAADLGIAYRYGQGVPVDRAVSIGWFLIADALRRADEAGLTFLSQILGNEQEIAKRALASASAEELAAGRPFAQRFIDDFARRTGAQLSLSASSP